MEPVGLFLRFVCFRLGSVFLCMYFLWVGVRLVVGTMQCMERLVSRITCYQVLSGTSKSTHSLAQRPAVRRWKMLHAHTEISRSKFV